MTTKHTPGPWRWVYIDGTWELIGANHEVVLDGDFDHGDWSQTINPNSPNGRLIAAAPELLMALAVAVERQGFTNAELIEARRILKKAMEG